MDKDGRRETREESTAAIQAGEGDNSGPGSHSSGGDKHPKG